MDAVTRLLNIYGEATIPIVVLVVFSAALIGKVVAAERERQRLKALLHGLLRQAMAAVEADTGLLVFFDRESQELFTDVAVGIDMELFMRGGLRRGTGVSGRVLETGESVLVEDLVEDARFKTHPLREELRRRDIRAVLSTPIVLADRVIGVMTLSSHQPRHFTEDHLPLVHPFAKETALAIGNAHIFEVTRTNWEA